MPTGTKTELIPPADANDLAAIEAKHSKIVDVIRTAMAAKKKKQQGTVHVEHIMHTEATIG